jgi:thioesterase domain-containing protein
MLGNLLSELSDKALDIIAEETGVARDELEPDLEFIELGVNGPLSKSIISRILQETNVNLPTACFVEYPTIASLDGYLQTISRTEVVAKELTKRTHATNDQNASSPPLSIVLQGKPASSNKIIFLLPDGSGSGMAYMSIPPIGSNVCLIGMNSPYLQSSPSEGTFVIEDTARMWADEIKTRQPAGPYILGGWSAGGYYSFEVAKHLMSEGHSLEKLILIDSPCRLVFEALPMEVVQYLSSNNLMGNWGAKKTPEWLVKHFDLSIRAISKYTPTPMFSTNYDPPEICILWAEDGVLPAGNDGAKTGLDLDVKVTRFLVQSRDEFGPHGWDKLFPGAKLSIATMPGNHFSIVHPPNVSPHSSFIQHELS